MDKSQHVLIIGFVWPEPQSSAAGRRMMELISLFQSRGWDITFASSAAETEYMADLESQGIQTKSVEINSSTFDEFVQDLAPSMVLFDRFVTEEQFGWRVAEQCPNALRILDTEDLHCLRRARKEAVTHDRDFDRADLFSGDDAKREIASIYRCDLTLMISEYEMELLQNVFGVDADLLQYLPFLLDPIDEANTQQWPDFEERQHFVTIGNFRHDPNADSVEFLYKAVWPEVRKQLPDAEFHIYGAYPNQRVKQLHKPEKGFYIEGRAPNADAVLMNAKVCLAPLRFGAGLKGKLIESIQCGTPSVTTPVGAEGINGELPWSGTVTEDPQEIAAGAVELFTNRAAWQRAQQNGIKIINKRFARQNFSKDLFNSIKNLKRCLGEHRRQNFTGQMLMHHRSASSKYMSRWIEAKNN